MTTVPTPEHDKLKAVVDKSQAIGEFLDWLVDDGIILSRKHVHTDACYEDDNDERVCGLSKGELGFDGENIQSRIARYFNINLEKIDQEKRAMLEELHAQHRSSKR